MNHTVIGAARDGHWCSRVTTAAQEAAYAVLRSHYPGIEELLIFILYDAMGAHQRRYQPCTTQRDQEHFAEAGQLQDGRARLSLALISV